MSKCAHGNTLESSLLLFYCLRCTCSCLTCMHACVMYTEVGNGEDSTMYHVKHCALIHSVLIHIINEATKKNKGQPARTHNQQLGREERGKRKEERGKRKEERTWSMERMMGVQFQESRRCKRPGSCSYRRTQSSEKPSDAARCMAVSHCQQGLGFRV